MWLNLDLIGVVSLGEFFPLIWSVIYLTLATVYLFLASFQIVLVLCVYVNFKL